MATIKVLILKHKKRSDGSCPLAIRVTIDRKPKYLYLGHSVLPKDWDEVLGRAKRSHPNSQRLNNLILKKITELDDIVIQSEAEHKRISSREVKKFVRGEGKNMSFFKYAEKYITDLYASNKYNRASADKPRVKRFREFVKDSDIRFSDINGKLLKSFAVHLRSKYQVSERTIMNYFVVIRTLFNSAIREGHAERKHYPFGRDGIQIKFPDSMKVGLDEDEIKKIESLSLEQGSDVWHSRNVFLFSFYLAGARISDVLRMRWDDIDKERLNYRMGKNQKTVSLKIPGKAMVILEHYKKEDSVYVFPELEGLDDNDHVQQNRSIRTATKKLNTNLREVAQQAGINKKITNHIARHSFGNISGDKIPVQILQKLYRHSNISTTIGYQSGFINKEMDDALDKVLGF